MKKVLITGVAQGFGKFLAKRFAEEGYSVGGIDKISSEELDTDLSPTLAYYKQMDLSDTAAVSQTAQAIFEDFMPDILINNAAVKFFQNFEDTSVADIMKVTNVNFISPLVLTGIWLNQSRHTKLICVFISSNAAYYGYAQGTLYCSTKSALRSFAQALTDENRNKKLRVITLCPESFQSTSTSVSNDSDIPFSMQEIYTYLIRAINSGKSGEIAILKLKTKLRYCFYESKKFIKWFMERK